jgi:hypothetical protein
LLSGGTQSTHLETKSLTADCGVDDLVNLRKGEWVFGAGLVEAGIVNAHSPFPILLLDQDGVGQPIGVLDLFNEAGVQEPCELLANHLALLFIEAAEVLLHWLGAGLDVEAVLGNLTGMSGMSEGFHVKMSALSRRSSVRATSLSGDIPAPI